MGRHEAVFAHACARMHASPLTGLWPAFIKPGRVCSTRESGMQALVRECLERSMMQGAGGTDRPELRVAVIHHLKQPMRTGEEPSKTQEEDVVASEALDGAVALHHDDLRRHGDRLHVDAECPQHSVDPCVPCHWVRHQSKQRTWHELHKRRAGQTRVVGGVNVLVDTGMQSCA